MTFEELLDHAIAMLQRRGRITYRALQRQFALDEDALTDLKDELLYAHPEVHDDAGRGLVWTGDAGTASTTTSAPVESLGQAPLAYTPPYLAEKILTSRSALEGERKQVTVLFADLKGSMELLADRDPEEARQLLDPVLERMMAAVHRYEGTVNQVMGDGIMALFGAPLAHEDHAVRACYAALRMQEDMQQYATEVQRTHGVPLHIRVGLNAGEVVVRSIGSDLHMDYTAVGQTTHLAARMEQMAMPGAILITPAVLGLVEGFVQVKELGAMPVRGLRDPVEVYEVTGASVVRSRLQAAASRGLTRFVGRQSELEALQQVLVQAQAGHGQVVAMVGEAGVGKSRLLYEFYHSHHTQGWLVLESASVSYGKATPYFPVVDLLKRYCHIEERDAPRTIRAKVTGQILALDEALHETIPALLALLDTLPADSPFLTLDPPQRRQRLLTALKRLLLRESQVQPLLLVFEDLHWIDAETQALLDSLVESVPSARLLLLVNYRPEYQHGWGSKTYYTQLRLDPLPPVSADEFLHGLLGDDASLKPLTHLLIARTEGNPFFLEESVRTLVETGVLVGECRAYHLGQVLPTIQVPATVQAVLAARIDRLPPEEKRLLQTAAVVGTEVPLPLLQTIAELPEAALHSGLVHLQVAELLYETRLFPEQEYTFKHALTHEVAYSSLLQERRRTLHARITVAMETLSADHLAEQIERLAHHALRGEVWDKALPYLWQAGTKAAARSAYREAVAFFEQALGALDHLPEGQQRREQAIDLRCDLRNAYFALGEYGRILDYLREAELFAEVLGDPHRLGRVALYMAQYFSAMGDHERCRMSGQRVLVVGTTLSDVALQVAARHSLGVASWALGDYRRAVEYLTGSMASLPGALRQERGGSRSRLDISSRVYLGLCLAALGEFAEGIADTEEAVRLAEAVDNPLSLVSACRAVGSVYLSRGELQRAMAILQRGQELCHVSDIWIWLPPTAAALGYAYALAGRVAEAVPLLEQAVEHDTSWRGGAYVLGVAWLGETYLLAHRRKEALTYATRALELSRARKERGNEAWTLRLLGEMAAHCDPPETKPAAAHYRQALTLANELGMRPLQAHCHRGLGTLYAKTGRQEQARTALLIAIDLYHTMEMTFWLPQTEAALAQVEGC
jgi:class 3 adenylate cyclase/tetratricopeptide (TPR) repeat protein